jgi:surface antigen
VVVGIGADGSVTVREMNYAGYNVVSERTLSAAQAAAYNYIH